MGCVGGGEEAAQSRRYDNELREAKAKAKKIHKLLLLGTGNSGKSTFFKQLTQIHGEGFQQEEYQSAAKHIQDAMVVQMKYLLLTFKNQEDDDFKGDLPAGIAYFTALTVIIWQFIVIHFGRTTGRRAQSRQTQSRTTASKCRQ